MDTKPTKPVPKIDVVKISMTNEREDLLRDALRRRELEIRRRDVPLVIIDLSRYVLGADSRPDLTTAISWAASQASRKDDESMNVALVIPRDLLQTAWARVAQHGCLQANIAIFSDISRAYQWAGERMR